MQNTHMSEREVPSTTFQWQGEVPCSIFDSNQLSAGALSATKKFNITLFKNKTKDVYQKLTLYFRS